MNPPVSPAGHRCKGIALVLVLWVTALLSLIAASFTLATRTETRMSANELDRAQADALAEAGIRLGLMELLGQQEGVGSRTNGGGYQIVFAGEPVEISILPENAKVDLNRAPPELIQGLLTVCVDEPVKAEALSQAVLDWRDQDNERRPRGAEDTDYANAGLAYGARDNAFLSVTELGQVLGMTTDILQRLSGLVTVNSGLPQVDPYFAHRDVLLAIPGTDMNQVDRFMEQRRAGVPRNEVVNGLIAGGGNRYINMTEPRIFTIQATARTSGWVSAQHEAIIRLTGNRQNPYAIIKWSVAANPVDDAEDTDIRSGNEQS